MFVLTALYVGVWGLGVGVLLGRSYGCCASAGDVRHLPPALAAALHQPQHQHKRQATSHCQFVSVEVLYTAAIPLLRQTDDDPKFVRRIGVLSSASGHQMVVNSKPPHSGDEISVDKVPTELRSPDLDNTAGIACCTNPARGRLGCCQQRAQVAADAVPLAQRGQTLGRTGPSSFYSTAMLMTILPGLVLKSKHWNIVC
jgi:hypothetical protein